MVSLEPPRDSGITWSRSHRLPGVILSEHCAQQPFAFRKWSKRSFEENVLRLVMAVTMDWSIANPRLMLFEDEIGSRSCMAWQSGKTLSELFGNLTESVWICGAAQGSVIEIEMSGDVIRRDEGLT